MPPSAYLKFPSFNLDLNPSKSWPVNILTSSSGFNSFSEKAFSTNAFSSAVKSFIFFISLSTFKLYSSKLSENGLIVLLALSLKLGSAFINSSVSTSLTS